MKISKIKIALAILALGLLLFLGTAVAVHLHDGYGSYGHSGYSSWWQPTTYHYSWSYPATYYGYWYNSFDPWWRANIYGPVRTTYYWWGW